MQAVDFFTWMTQPPGATIFVLLLSIFLNTTTSIVTRVLTDRKELARKQATIKEHQDQKKELGKLEKENPKRFVKDMIRWKRREKAIQKMQQSMSMARLKPQCYTMIPMMILFFVLSGFFGSKAIALPAMNPASIPWLGDYVGAGKLGGWINFMTWYFLCSLGTSTIIQRLFGVAQQTSMSQMLGGGQEGSGFSTKDMFRKKS